MSYLDTIREARAALAAERNKFNEAIRELDHILAEGEGAAVPTTGTVRAVILHVLDQAPEASYSHFVAAVRASGQNPLESSVASVLTKMVAAGDLERVRRGVYRASA